MRYLRNLFFGTVEINVAEISREELKKLSDKFYISRTGVEMIDCFEKGMLPGTKELPPKFTTYKENIMSLEEYENLDSELMDIRTRSSSMAEYRQQAEEINYANCTSLACFLCDALESKGIDAKVFGLGGAHHFVIAQEQNNPNFIIVADPWTDIQFRMEIKNPVHNLEELSAKDRLRIAEKYSKQTGLYQDYREQLENLLNPLDIDDVNSREYYIEHFFDIQPPERWFEFNIQKGLR
ncbi:hypothetical protein [Legionella spiritensis]|uniref:hypothetical protein n=1 Tax=Legionella spiritensis TaxID=452 RepID=UPI000F6C367B|nr:hypothetical protein [Legionella spiritensis]VEG89795.1 Uncharacterised protein [Legionella spiritensis]